MFIDFNVGLIKQIKNFAEQDSGLKVLDIGCGEGDYTVLFGDRHEVVGIDILNGVRKKNNNFKFKIDDATNLSFKDNTFDLTVSFDVIEHLEDDKKMISEAYRVLKKGGRLFFGTPNKTRLINQALAIAGRPRTYPYLVGVDPVLGEMIHIKEYTAAELKKLLKDAGFKNIKITPYWFGLTVPFNYGLNSVPKPLSKYGHYLFFEGTK